MLISVARLHCIVLADNLVIFYADFDRAGCEGLAMGVEVSCLLQINAG